MGSAMVALAASSSDAANSRVFTAAVAASAAVPTMSSSKRLAIHITAELVVMVEILLGLQS